MKHHHPSCLLLLLICQPVLASEHSDEATYLLESYLKNNQFVKALPKTSAGQANEVSRQLSSHFSSHSKPTITGQIHIGELNGSLRLKVASTKNLLYQQKQIKVKFTATAGQGAFKIYSPVDMDFWQMAKLFIDTPDKYRPEQDPWKLQGYVVHTVEAGKTAQGQAGLLPMADEYHLILVAEEAAKDLRISLQ